MTPVELVLARLPDSTRHGESRWLARCPAHEDYNPRLTINEGADGRALLKCHAGCTLEEVCTALRMTKQELMPANESPPGEHVYVNGNGPNPQKNGFPETRGRSCREFATDRDAVAELERWYGPSAASWSYHNRQSHLVGKIVRWDLPDRKKRIRPISRHGNAWRIDRMPMPRPLYRLMELPYASRIYICEGEKAADAIRSLNLTATTSAHGSSSAHQTDWTPLADKEVIILADNDSPGREYAEGVRALLSKLTPAPVVKVVKLPNLPEGGDAADFLAAHPDSNRDGLRRLFERLADDAQPIALIEPAPLVVERYEPFPVDALPEPLRGFVTAGAKAIGCDSSYLALPLLTALAAAIGNTRQLQLKRSWTVPAILWCAIIGESGTSKTPAFRLAMRPIRERQRKALDRHVEATRKYDAELARYEKAYAQWKVKKKTNDEPPEKPKVPQAERCIVSDTTVEALAPLLLENSRGLLLARDELAGWIGSFDRYSGGKGGADAAHWLSMFNGESLVVDRKTGSPRTIFVPQASVCICGGIQPGILHRALGNEHRESGLAARLLLAYPPRTAKRWTEADIDSSAEDEIARLVERLYELNATQDEDGKMRPVVVGLERAAKKAWTTYYNAHAHEHIDLTGDLSAAWSKLEEYPARLALVIHFARWAAEDPQLAHGDVVDVVSINAGIRLANWFKGEARRVYALLDGTEQDCDRQKLLEWLERKEGPATAREVRLGCRWLKEPGAADSALEALVKAGLGQWEPTPPGQRGQPTRYFRLTAPSSVYGNSALPAENPNTVDVDAVASSEIDAAHSTNGEAPAVSDDEWGEL